MSCRYTHPNNHPPKRSPPPTPTQAFLPHPLHHSTTAEASTSSPPPDSPLLQKEVGHLDLVGGTGDGHDPLHLTLLDVINVNLRLAVGADLTDARAALANDGSRGLTGGVKVKEVSGEVVRSQLW